MFFEKYKEYFGIDSKLKQKLKTSEINFKCYREVIDYYETTCLDYSEYAIQYYKYFSISCSNNNSNNLDIDSELDSESLNEKDIIKVIDELCKLLI